MKKLFRYEEYVKKIDEIKEKYPFLICHKIGESVLKKDIFGLSIGNYKNVVLFIGGFKGKEMLSVDVLLEYIENVCFAFKNKTHLAGVNISSSLMTKGLTVIPCINPDGLEIYSFGKDAAKEYSQYVYSISKGQCHLWESNVKGIDISRNFNSSREKIVDAEIKKGIFGPSMYGYGGFSAESEPETRAIVNFCEKNNVHHAFSLVGSRKEIYWQGENLNPENSRTMAKILSVCSGYGIANARTEEDFGSFKDWFCENYNRSAFSIGVPKKENDFLKAYSMLEEMLVIGTII